MIVNNYNSNQKIPKKCLPQSLKIRVIIVVFISSDDDIGLSLYKNNQVYSPINYTFDVAFDGKLKCKTFADLEQLSANICKNNREYIKQAKEKFEADFSTKIELEDVADRYVYVDQMTNQTKTYAMDNQEVNCEGNKKDETSKTSKQDNKTGFKKHNKMYMFEKQIFCIMKQCEEIEHTINPEFVRDCVVVSLDDFQQFATQNTVADFCVDFMYNFK